MLSPKEEGYFDGYDGLKLYYRAVKVDDSKSIVVIVHGLAEHTERYNHLINSLAKAGFTTYIFDLRGHGKSNGVRGHVKFFDEYLLDLKKFIELVREKERIEKVFLFGHSLGGLIALRFAVKFSTYLKGVISSSAALRTTVPVSKVTLAIGKLLSKIAPTVKFSNNINPSLLTHDASVVKSYINDPLIFRKITARFAMELFEAADETFSKAHELRVPCLLLAGAEDKIVDPNAIVEFYNKLSVHDKEIKIYDGMYHEILNELGKEKVISDIINWLNNHSTIS